MHGSAIKAPGSVIQDFGPLVARLHSAKGAIKWHPKS
jgi:hypothetical protein